MDFSVLMAVYKKDTPSFLNESLNSLFLQTLKPAKIVLVKDGNISEELESVIEKWKSNLPLEVVGYEHNQGLAHALNYGLDFVETELIARMDSDDICEVTRFEKQVRFMTENSEVNICGSNITEFYVDKYGNELRRNRAYPQVTDSKSCSLFKGTPLAHPTVMFRLSLIKQYKYLENTSMNEDIDLWFRLLLDNNILYVLQESLLNYRITDDTFKRRSIYKSINEYKIYSKYLKQLFGFNLLSVYPVARFLTRLLPYGLNKKLYFSKIRKNLFKEKS